MNKKEILQSLLSQLSIQELTNALRTIKLLAKQGLLQPKYIDALLHVAEQMEISTPDYVQTVTVITSGVDAALFGNALSDMSSQVTTKQQDSDDVSVIIRGQSLSYRRSLDHDIDVLLS